MFRRMLVTGIVSVSWCGCFTGAPIAAASIRTPRRRDRRRFKDSRADSGPSCCGDVLFRDRDSTQCRQEIRRLDEGETCAYEAIGWRHGDTAEGDGDARRHIEPATAK